MASNPYNQANAVSGAGFKSFGKATARYNPYNQSFSDVNPLEEQKQIRATNDAKVTQLAKQVVQQQQNSAPALPKTPNKPGYTTPASGLINKIVTYGRALVTSPGTTVSRVATGQGVSRVDNGAIVSPRMPLSESSKIKSNLGGGGSKGKTTQLDHTIPLEIGGTNQQKNLKLMSKAQDQANNPVEDYLGQALKLNLVNAKTAQNLMTQYKQGKLTDKQIYKLVTPNSKISSAPNPIFKAPTALPSAPNNSTTYAKGKLQPLKTKSGVADTNTPIEQLTEFARGFTTKPVAQLATSLEGKQNTYTPKGRLQQAIFGKQPIQNLEKIAANTADTHRGKGSIPLAIGDVAFNLLNDIPVVGGAAKLLKGGAEVAKGAAGVSDASKLAILTQAKEKLGALKAEHPGQPAVDKMIAQADKKIAEVHAAGAKAEVETAKTSEKTAVQTKKIDQKVELLQAKKADTGELTSVDKVKLKQLGEQRQEITGEQVPKASSPDQVQTDANFAVDYYKKYGKSAPPQKSAQVAIKNYEGIGAEVPEHVQTAATRKFPNSKDAESGAVPVKPPPVESAPTPTTRSLTPSETAHMPEIGGYTHSEHMAQDYADMLRGQEQSVKGGQMIKNADGSYRRISEHSRFYRDYFKENGKAPTKAVYLDEAKKELESGKDAIGASAHYKQLLEREGKPVPRVKVESTVKNTPQGTSKVAKRIANNIKEQYGDLAQYDKVSIADQAQKAEKLIKDRASLDKVISGEKPLPDGLRATSLITAVRSDPELIKDGELLKRLASSPLASESSYSAQEMRLARENAKNDPVEAIRSISKARQDAFKAKTGKTADEAVSKEVEAIRNAKPKVTKMNWNQFVESIKC